MNSFFINKLKPSELKTIAYFTGIICIILGVFQLIPIIFALIYHDNIHYINSFLISSALSLTLGFIIHHFYKKEMITDLSLKGALIFVFSIWGVTALISSLPYYFSGILGPLDSLFQSMSGITTTGFSLITSPTIPYSIAFWEVFTQWYGGLGMILLIVAVIPSSTSLKRLYFAEGRTEQMTPNIRHTSIIFIKLYLFLSAIGVILYIIVGLPLFEAFCYSATAIATGGFSVFPESVNYFQDFPIQLVTIILMILGSTNFILIYRVLTRNFKSYYKDSETKTMWFVIILATALIAMSLLSNQIYGSDVILSIRHALFQVVSIMSSTGFSSTDINMWSPFCYQIMILLMICGGGICSTSSGIKLYNIYLLFKSFWWEGQSMFLPKNSVIVKRIYHDKKYIDITNNDIRSVLIYVMAYIMIFILGATIILIYTQNLELAYTISASSLGNTGLGPAYVGIAAPAAVKIVMIIEFWIGRTGMWPILLLIVYEINKVGEISEKINEK